MGGKWMGWVGMIMTVLTVLFLLMDAGMKLAGAKASVDATGALGFDPAMVRTLGVILLVSTLLYAFPATAPLGAILVTAYLGGAVAVQWQHKAALGSQVLFGVYVGVLLWGGLWFRSAALRQILPWAGN